MAISYSMGSGRSFLHAAKRGVMLAWLLGGSKGGADAEYLAGDMGADHVGTGKPG